MRGRGIPALNKRRFPPEVKYHIVVAMVLVVFLVIASVQKYVFLLNAGHDDALYYFRAGALTTGNWLGPYNQMALAKNISYALWLAIWHTLGVPLLWVNALFYAGACYFVVYALKPLMEGILPRALTFCFLLFNPLTFSVSMMRVYRDSIAPTVILFVVGWVAGVYLRASRRKDTKLRAYMPFCIAGCIFLPAWWFLREDSFWLAPLVLAGLFFTALFLFGKKRGGITKWSVAKLVVMVLPVGFTVLCGLGIATLNKVHYGRFVVNDYTSSDFKDAYGALTRVRHEELIFDVPVSQDAREKLYQASPAFRELQLHLDNDGQGLCEGWKQTMTGENAAPEQKDYLGGAFFWALRDAVAAEGYYENAATAQEYYLRLAAEVNTACDDGLLPVWAGKRSGVMPPFHSEYLHPTLEKTGEALWLFMSFRDITYAEAGIWQIPMEQMEAAEAYIHSEGYLPGPPKVLLKFLVEPTSAEVTDSSVSVGLVAREGGWQGEATTIETGTQQSVWLPLPDGLHQDQYPQNMEDYAVVLTDSLGNTETLDLMGPEVQVQSNGDRLHVEMTMLKAQIEDNINVSSPFEKAVRMVQHAVLAVYQMGTPVLFFAAFALLVAAIVHGLVKNRRVLHYDIVILAAGLLATILLRAVMLAFVTVSSFPSIIPLYASSAYPLVLVFIAVALTYGVGILWPAVSKRKKPAGEK